MCKAADFDRASRNAFTPTFPFVPGNLPLTLRATKKYSAMPAPTVYLWIYIVLLVAGGLMGFLKSNSKMSLLTSLVFALVLILCAVNAIKHRYAADITLLVLLFFFGLRFVKSKKFMPMGMMALLTVVTLALRQLSQ